MPRPDAAASAMRCARPSDGLAGSPDPVLEDDMMIRLTPIDVIQACLLFPTNPYSAQCKIPRVKTLLD